MLRLLGILLVVAAILYRVGLDENWFDKSSRDREDAAIAVSEPQIADSADPVFPGGRLTGRIQSRIDYCPPGGERCYPREWIGTFEVIELGGGFVNLVSEVPFGPDGDVPIELFGRAYDEFDQYAGPIEITDEASGIVIRQGTWYGALVRGDDGVTLSGWFCTAFTPADPNYEYYRGQRGVFWSPAGDERPAYEGSSDFCQDDPTLAALP